MLGRTVVTAKRTDRLSEVPGRYREPRVGRGDTTEGKAWAVVARRTIVTAISPGPTPSLREHLNHNTVAATPTRKPVTPRTGSGTDLLDSTASVIRDERHARVNRRLGADKSAVQRAFVVSGGVEPPTSRFQ